MLRTFIAILVLILPLSAAFAADAQFQGIITGHYFDSSMGALRAILGNPGAAYLSSPLISDLDAAWLAPNGRSALAFQKGLPVFLQTFDAGVSSLAVNSIPTSVDRISWSTDSTSVVLYSSAQNLLQLFTGLPDHPVLAAQVDLTAIGNTITALRLSPDSRHIALTTAMDTSTSLYLLQNLGPPFLVTSVSNAGPIDFSADSQTLFVVDKTINRLLNVPVMSPDTPQALALDGPEQAPGDFTDLLVSRDGQLLYALLHNADKICGFVVNTGNTAFCTALDFTPSSLERLADSLYLLNIPRGPRTPIWLLDGVQGSVYFVPTGEQH